MDKIVEMLAAGDPSSADLLNDLSKKLFKIAIQILGSNRKEDAEDYVQEDFLEHCEHSISSGENASSPLGL